MKETREKTEAIERTNMKKRTDLEGRMLLAVEAAARAGLRYTENFDALGEGEESCGDEMLTFLLASESIAAAIEASRETPVR